MKTINDLKDNKANDMESGYYLALIDVLKLNDKIKADLLYSKSLSEKECKIIEKYNEELKLKINGENEKRYNK